MQYVPYPEQAKAWASEGWTNQLTAVMMPGEQESISTMSEYLDLLALRLNWMINERIKEVQEMGVEEPEMTPKEQVLQEIRAIASFSRMGNLNLNNDPMQWARVMVLDFPDFHEALDFLGMRENPPRDLFKFPLNPLETEDAESIRELILETTLEEWLTLMRAAMTNLD